MLWIMLERAEKDDKLTKNVVDYADIQHLMEM